ncbi:MAG: ATP-binding cassette domain-containing protein [Brooklawnia sp.]|nr:ATP-binding cassette domain-containing protein [Brooklawnia sp.]
MIKLDGVGKDYSTDVTIGPIDLEIPQGGITALVGPNGAGKSTMLTMIGRLLRMDTGAIQVAGMNVASTRSKDLAKVLSILRQENHFVTRLTVRQLIGFGRFPHSGGRLNVADEQIISHYVDFLDLRELEGRFLDQLSGGQRQRAYVAMVLAQETPYVLLDEPLNNLDIAHSVRMMRHLRRAADELGRTIIIVLHDINFAAAYADRICMVKDGVVARFGTPAELMRQEVLSEIFNTKIHVVERQGCAPVAVYF